WTTVEPLDPEQSPCWSVARTSFSAIGAPTSQGEKRMNSGALTPFAAKSLDCQIDEIGTVAKSRKVSGGEPPVKQRQYRRQASHGLRRSSQLAHADTTRRVR